MIPIIKVDLNKAIDQTMDAASKISNATGLTDWFGKFADNFKFKRMKNLNKLLKEASVDIEELNNIPLIQQSLIADKATCVEDRLLQKKWGQLIKIAVERRDDSLTDVMQRLSNFNSLDVLVLEIIGKSQQKNGVNIKDLMNHENLIKYDTLSVKNALIKLMHQYYIRSVIQNSIDNIDYTHYPINFERKDLAFFITDIGAEIIHMYSVKHEI